MHDMVLSYIDAALEERAVNSLKFNFRGVGASEGQHDKGVGESDDLVFVSNWLRENHDVSRLIVCGYSFGAVVVLGSLARLGCDDTVLIAPAISMLAGSNEPPATKTLVVLGGNDEFVDVDTTRSWFAPESNRVEVIEGTDHFFFGAGDRIVSLVGSFISENQV